MLTEDPEGQKMAETLIEVGIMGNGIELILSKYVHKLKFQCFSLKVLKNNEILDEVSLTKVIYKWELITIFVIIHNNSTFFRQLRC